VADKHDQRTPRIEIEFRNGIPGFANERRFLFVEQPNLAPLVHIQSLRSPDLHFVALPVAFIDPSYEVQLNSEDLRGLDLATCPETAGEAGLLCLAILAADEHGPPTANLLAPIVVNLALGLGVQAVRMDSRYSHSYSLGEVPSCS
jgi:flagellar assembly factor FliW